MEVRAMTRPQAYLAPVTIAALLCQVLSTQAQSPPIAPDQQYLLLDTYKMSTFGASRNPTLQKELDAAGQQGFAIQFSSANNILLKRDGTSPHVYRLVTTAIDSTPEQELTTLGRQGFRLVAASILQFANEWVMAVEKQPGEARYTYSVVKGDDAVDANLNALRREGGRVVGILGRPPGEWQFSTPKPVFIVEKGAGAATDTGADRQYRVLSTQKTSTLQKEIVQAGNEGFRPIGTGYSTIVVERDPATEPPRVEYRLVSAKRLGTIEKEVNELAERGFRVLPQASFNMSFAGIGEAIFVLGRTPGVGDRYHYGFIETKKDTIDDELRKAGADGHAPVRMFGSLIITEKVIPAR
jgi:hypothetical protein